MFDNQLKEKLKNVRSIAIVGAVDKEGRPVDRVGKYLINRGFTVYPVHPVRKDVWGLQTFKDIKDLSIYLKNNEKELDVICFFRASQYCYDHAVEVIESELNPKIFWLQEGIISPEAGNYITKNSNIKYIEDRCIKIDYENLLPNDFECDQCGICCEGKNGIVVDDVKDLPRLLEYFNISKEELDNKYTLINNKKRVLRSGEDNYCLFYDKEKSCTIHPARPDICRAWPYFRGNVVDQVSFEMAKDDCKGIMPFAKHENFQKEAFTYLKENNLFKDIDDKSSANALKYSANELKMYE